MSDKFFQLTDNGLIDGVTGPLTQYITLPIGAESNVCWGVELTFVIYGSSTFNDCGLSRWVFTCQRRSAVTYASPAEQVYSCGATGGEVAAVSPLVAAPDVSVQVDFNAPTLGPGAANDRAWRAFINIYQKDVS